MKLCCTCKIEKEVSLFYKNKSTKDGLYKQCVSCVKDYYKTNKAKINESNNARYAKNKDTILSKNKEYRVKNRDRLNSSKKVYYRKNKQSFIKRSRERHRRLVNATPSWLTQEDKRVIDGMYNLARFYGWITGEEWHVDHIVPLKGKAVCGLHVPLNLQPVPKRYNLAKNNKF